MAFTFAGCCQTEAASAAASPDAFAFMVWTMLLVMVIIGEDVERDAPGLVWLRRKSLAASSAWCSCSPYPLFFMYFCKCDTSAEVLNITAA